LFVPLSFLFIFLHVLFTYILLLSYLFSFCISFLFLFLYFPFFFISFFLSFLLLFIFIFCRCHVPFSFPVFTFHSVYQFCSQTVISPASYSGETLSHLVQTRATFIKLIAPQSLQQMSVKTGHNISSSIHY
jgi:hypothetical protein